MSIARQVGQRPTEGWTYRDADGQPAFRVVKYEGATGNKTYRPIYWNGDNWIASDPPGMLPPYGVLDLGDDDPIYIVEGEKCVDVLRNIGLIATTSAHGAKGAKKTDWSPLAGRDVVILPDNDGAGRQYAEDVRQLLAALDLPATVKILALPDLPPGGDIVDFLADRQGTASEVVRAEIHALADTVESVSVPAPIETGLAGIEFPPPVPASELGQGEPIDWVWEGYAARGFITVLTGLWKAGKTTLVAHLIRTLCEGGNIAGSIKPGKVLVVSEEAAQLWRDRSVDLGIGDDAHFDIRPFIGRPTQAKWEEFLARTAALVRQHDYSLVIFDTLATFLPVDDENAAAKMMTALGPLHRITEAGAAILLLHHPKKGDSSEGQASRGSGALPGFVDIIVELRRHDPRVRSDRRRVLTSYSRFDETPPEAVIELTDRGYKCVGTKRAATQTDRMSVIAQLLEPVEHGMTAEEVRDAWPTDGIPKPGLRMLRDDLNAGTPTFEEGNDRDYRWWRQGKGAKGSPYRYLSIARGVAELIDYLRSQDDSIPATTNP